ncbi:MAG: SMC-Scp complex subunit ScpB [Bacillota bacterium]|jgi:segregation and condensation protein B
MPVQNQRNMIEALLFVAYEPVTLKKLAEITGLGSQTVLENLLSIQKEYAERGFHLTEIAGGWQFLTDETFAPQIERLYNPRKQVLSKAALETLAIIAYRQPITRLEIENIRQVKIDSMVNKLMDKKLIKEAGRLETPGKPILYGTTKEFLAFFGIDSLKDLPPLEEFAQSFDNMEEEVNLFNLPAGAFDSADKTE